MRLPVNRIAPLAAVMLLAACSSSGELAQGLPPEPANGPAADYPMVIGAPFVVDGKTYTPVDTMNYDAVGYAGIDATGAPGISAAHRTMPLPSYLEVTALGSGKTILVRIERRGPMTGARLIDLSPSAAAQLGIAGQDRAAVRVRRVNPPEAERALLRAGQAAPARMDTPKSLLAVLTRKLDQQDGIRGAVPQAQPAPPAILKPLPTPLRPEPVTRPEPAAMPAPKPTASPAPAPPPKSAAQADAQLVQVAAFSTRERAATVAAKLGAQVSRSGRLWRVRMGPFSAQTEAAAALAKARAAGYSDARIQRAD